MTRPLRRWLLHKAGAPVRWWYETGVRQVLILAAVLGGVAFATFALRKELPAAQRVMALAALVLFWFVNVTYRARTMGRRIKAIFARATRT